MSAKIIAIFSNKGGVLKTTTATNLAAELALKKRRTLLVDTDGQGHVARSFGYDPTDPREFIDTLEDLLINNPNREIIENTIINAVPYLDFIPANSTLFNFEASLFQAQGEGIEANAWGRLANVLDPIKDEYDYIIIDTAPAQGLLAGNVLAVADEIVIPVKMEDKGLSSLKLTIQTIKEQNERNANIFIRAIVPTMFKANTNVHRELLEQIREWAAEESILVTDTVIPETVQYGDADSRYHLPLALVQDSYYKKTKQYYRNLLKELGYK